MQYCLTSWHCAQDWRPLTSAVLPWAYSHASGWGMRMPLWQRLQESFCRWQALQVESTPTAPCLVGQSFCRCDTGMAP